VSGSGPDPSPLIRLLRSESARGLALLLLVLGPGLWATLGISVRTYTPGARTMTVADMDLPIGTDVRERKRRFFAYLRPVVVGENTRVARQRARLLRARAEGGDDDWVAALAAEYRVPWGKDGGDWDKLLARVDTVPVELALAQSAHESRWGTSRFAREGNNLFGQWCYADACGLVPERRPPGAVHKVASFAHANEAVRNYLYNLNVGHAYTAFRRMRARARAEGRPLDALSLAAGLTRYSERGARYVQEIRDLIRANRALMRSPGAGLVQPGEGVRVETR
jgi:Bax protein